jgi:hypothetical protein
MIGIGCVSATDNNSSYIDDTPSHLPDEQQINAHAYVNYPTPEANDKRTDINDKVLPEPKTNITPIQINNNTNNTTSNNTLHIKGPKVSNDTPQPKVNLSKSEIKRTQAKMELVTKCLKNYRKNHNIGELVKLIFNDKYQISIKDVQDIIYTVQNLELHKKSPTNKYQGNKVILKYPNRYYH